MKIQMRPAPTQFLAPVRFTIPGSYSIDLSKYIAAGCTQVYSLCIGGAGGASNDFITTVDGKTYTSRGAGGAGGSSRYRVHSLTAFLGALVQPITVGAAGVKGAGSGGSGSNGSPSHFGAGGAWNSAPGGKAAIIGRLVNSGPTFYHESAKGGWGVNPLDPNEQAPGEPGAAGYNGQVGTLNFDPRSPIAGNWVTSGLTLPDLAIGIGGGGGSGTFTSHGPSTNRAAQNGTSGAGTSGDQYSPGYPAFNSQGGGGGGAREKFLTGIDQHYGSNHTAANCKASGAVILKFV